MSDALITEPRHEGLDGCGPTAVASAEHGSARRYGRPVPGALGRAVALQFVIAAGDALAGVALSIRVYHQTHAPWAVTVVMVAVSLPVVLLSPVSGLVLDRRRLSPTLAVGAVGVAGVLVALGLTSNLWLSFGLVALFGVGDGLLAPGLGSAVPMLAGDRPTQRANGYLTAATLAGFACGPMLAGVVVSAGGAGLAMFCDAAGYALAAIGLLSLRLGRRPGGDGADDEGAPSGLGQLTAGLRAVRADRTLTTLLAIVTLMVGFANLSTVAELFFANNVLHAGAGGYAGLVTAWTGGMAIGTLVGGRLPERTLARVVLLGVTCTGVGIIVASGSPTLWGALVAYGLGGMANGFEVVATRTLLSVRTPERVHGRVFALYMALLTGASSFGFVMASVLVPALGARGALALAGALGGAPGAIGLLRWRRFAAEPVAVLEPAATGER